MEDPFLSAQIHGEHPLNLKEPSPDREYEEELEKIAEAYAEEEAEALALKSHLFTAEQAKEHLKREFKEAVRLEEQQGLLKQAIRCILEDGKKYLSGEEWELLSNEVSHAAEALAKLSYQEELPDKLFSFLGMTQKGMDAIDAIGRAKYQEENFSLSVALNALLTTLNPEALIYWLHLGISYQDSGFYEKAVKAYSICHLLDPSHLPAWIFCSECYIHSHLKEEAIAEYGEASRIIESLEDRAPWEEHLFHLKKVLKI